MLASSSTNAIKRSQGKLITLASLTPATSGLSSGVLRQQRNASLLSKSMARSNLRHELWNFTPDLAFQNSSATRPGPLGRYNLALSKLSANGRLMEALRVCTEMNVEGVKPDILTFNALISACIRDGLFAEAWVIYNDMVSCGISPERDTFHKLLQVNSRQPIPASLDIWNKMLASDIKPNIVTYEILIERLTEDKNLEMAVLMLKEMESQDLAPSAETAANIINLAATVGHPRLALDLAMAYEADSVRPLSDETWVRCLGSCAESLYVEGTRHCWEKVVHDLRIVPDEGLCIDVLHTAGREGLPSLATDVIRVLTEQKVPLEEYHFCPLIEAFCSIGMIKDAFGVLSFMEKAGIMPLSETPYSIYQQIESDAEALDSACTALEELRDESHSINIVALNCLISASVNQGDLQRALGVYNSCSTFGCTPNIETFNLLLEGCIVASHRELGDKLLIKMKEAAVKPTQLTYERLVILCLTQDVYEDAFFYLEEMKGLSMVPSITLYEAIIQRCVSMGDTRFRLAVEEMKECGYSMSRRLRDYIDSGGEPKRVEKGLEDHNEAADEQDLINAPA